MTQPRDNWLLYSLPDEGYRRIAPEFVHEPLPAGTELHRQAGGIDSFYFVTSGLMSLLHTTQDGHSTEISVVGHEGGVGLMLVLGQPPPPMQAIVQVSGDAWTLSGDLLRQEFGRGGALQRSLLRYVQVLMTQMGQTTVCNRHHTVAQQLCRWILLILERTGGDDLHMTQEMIANMLGVRRAGVTEAAQRLQAAGLIDYRRGRIRVCDYAMLEASACECYGVIRAAYDEFHQDLTGSSRR